MIHDIDNNIYSCYFCDVPYMVLDDRLIKNYSNLLICVNCDNLFPINYDNRENGKCGVCMNYKSLIKQNNCGHYLCVDCCKKEYFGISKKERPIHWHESYINNIIEPDWPFQIDDDEYDENNEELFKYQEYIDFDNDHFDKNKTYNELISIRDNLMLKRPEWMNTDIFINYENLMFKYHTEYKKIYENWEIFNENKIIGKKWCPFCKK